jgi:hypothetical protein
MTTNPNTPYGLQPYTLQGSKDWRDSVVVYLANTTNAMYVGDPVVKVAASADINGINTVNLVAAGSSHPITGVVVGFQGSGAPQLGNYNPGSLFSLSGTPGPAFKPANTANFYVLVADDPSLLYVAQSNDSGTATAPAATIVGKNANLVSGAGSAFTGWSGWMLNSGSVGTSANAQVNIVGVLPEADNVVGSVNAKFIVRLNNSTEVNAATGI